MPKTSEEELAKWSFFCKEVAKANDTLDTIEKMWKNINIHDNAYNPIFSLLIDALTTKVFLHVRHLFDSQGDALRLSRVVVDIGQQDQLKKLEKDAEPFIEAVNKQHAHISKRKEEINYSSNFRLMNEHNAAKIREILNGVSSLLRQWGIKHNEGGVVADRWGNIGTSADILFEHLKEYEFITGEMSAVDHVEVRERMKKVKNV